MTRAACVWLLLAIANTAFAASFDCKKASTTPEKLICADSTLSGLDDRLAQTYKSASADAATKAEVQKRQKDWLRAVRNTCTSVPCLVAAYEVRIGELAPRQPTAQNVTNCPVPESALIATWENLDGGFFQQMQFSVDESERRFDSWLHSGPDLLGGRWKFAKCNLSISDPFNEDRKFSYEVVRVQGDRLYLRDSSHNNIAAYQRIEE